MIKHLSARSFRVAISDIPFIIMGRLALNKDSESSVCNIRVEKPLPVANRHKESESRSCKPDKLSKLLLQQRPNEIIPEGSNLFFPGSI